MYFDTFRHFVYNNAHRRAISGGLPLFLAYPRKEAANIMSIFIFILFFAVQLALGVVSCFFGYRYIRKLMTVTTFLLTSVVCFLVFAPMTGLSALLAALLSVLAGLAAALLIYFLYHVGIFLTGAVMGFLIAFSVLLLFRLPIFTVFGGVFILLFFIAGGCFAIVYRRPIIILSTAFNGAATLAVYGGFLLHSLTAGAPLGTPSADLLIRRLTLGATTYFSENRELAFVITLALGVIGAVVQFRRSAPEKKQPAKKKKAAAS